MWKSSRECLSAEVSVMREQRRARALAYLLTITS
jgi:hypothetical protein